MNSKLVQFAAVLTIVFAAVTMRAQETALQITPPAAVALSETSAQDEFAQGVECYKIETPQAVYYLDKVGAGLSSMIDRDGNDWLSFHSKAGSGAAGEYRGFPNAVFKENGSYFHPRNAGTDPCVTVVEELHPDRVVISALSSNGMWAGRYEFTQDACIFTLTKKPAHNKYWVLYEGTPGGQYDSTDWWMSSDDAKKSPLTSTHEGDIAGPEWIAFGDQKLDRMLFLSHVEDDDHPDRFYQMQEKMTVFGFGREGMRKFLNSVPQSFVIGFVETTDHTRAEKHIAAITAKMAASTNSRNSASGIPDQAAQRRALEQFALTSKGNADAGRRLFAKDQRTKCETCHRVHEQGGEVGPDLSKIGGKFARPHLIESLLEPSRQIVEGYHTSVIVTEDGTVQFGVIKSRNDRTVTLVDAKNRPYEIDVSEIEEQVETSVSIMPQGLANALSPQEFTDLIAYLETLRSGGKPKFGSGVSGPIQIPDGFEIKSLATGLTGATALEVLPDGRVFICEQTGSLRVVKDGKLLPDPFVTLPVDSYWERGLIGVAVAPDFPHDPFVYVVYVAKEPYAHHRVSRFRADGDVAVPGSEEILLRGDDQRTLGGHVPAGHQGGAIHFGKDGKLYVGIGEQTANLPAQKLDTFQGKLLRINPDGTIPSDNPFLEQTTGKYQAIWALGCRNPFTFAVQESTGTIFINDVGGKHEEINRGVSGANYGWPVVDHGPTQRQGFVGPIHIYPESSISGGDFANSNLGWPEKFRGQYFFADFVHGWIHMIDPDSPWKADEFASGLRRPVDVRFSADGSLYVLLRNAWVIDDKFEGGTGSLLQIRPRIR